jgi:hypothetical protein
VEGICEKAGKDIGMKAYVTNYEISLHVIPAFTYLWFISVILNIQPLASLQSLWEEEENFSFPKKHIFTFSYT